MGHTQLTMDWLFLGGAHNEFYSTPRTLLRAALGRIFFRDDSLLFVLLASVLSLVIQTRHQSPLFAVNRQIYHDSFSDIHSMANK